MRHDDASAIRALRAASRALRGDRHDFDPVLERVGDARVVLLGEASHGTHEFYAARAKITRRLIAERGFGAVAVEADWPDAYRVNRYVRGQGPDANADRALSGFRRFPTWMWRNEDVLAFVAWLRDHNRDLAGAASRKRPRHLTAVRTPSAATTEATAGDAGPVPRPTGFYGLDLYSLHSSIAAVLDYLDRVDPPAARRARERYACFDHFGEDVQAYGYAAGFGLTESCHREVIRQLIELRQLGRQVPERERDPARDDYFFAEQNARLVRNAEAYYRTMFEGHIASWNRRDSHMAETLEHLLAYLDRDGSRTKVVAWAHNSHLGDARATDMGRQGEYNLGQLVRQRYGAEAVNVGFTTHSGTVTAASDWDAPSETKAVRPGLDGSYEQLFHDTALGDFLVDLGDPALAEALLPPRLERAIGVIYRPETERQSHYFQAELARQFDMVLHYDRTRALAPLPTVQMAADEPPETWPSAL